MSLKGVFQILLAVLMMIFSTLVFVQVLVRYVIDLGLFGLNDITALIAVWMYFLGAGYAAKSGEHISASLVDVVFPLGSPPQKATAIFASVVSALVMLVFAWWAFEYSIWTVQRGAVTDELKLPRLHFAVPIFAGCLLMAWFFAATAMRETSNLYRAHDEDV